MNEKSPHEVQPVKFMSAEQIPSLEPESGPSAEAPGARPGSASDGNLKAFNDVVQSEIGVSTLLNRLKQSIASAQSFATFLKKRSVLEEEHAQGLKRICRSTHEVIRRPDNRQGSYSYQFEEITKIHDRMADNGIQFALSLHQMHDDLTELAANMDRSRKQWKQTNEKSEKRSQESTLLMERARTKYNSLAEDYDRAKTGDKASGRVFGLKGPKSAAQHEEDLFRKLQAADSDYVAKVQTAGSHRQELVSQQRPQAVKQIQDLITECDSALTLQLQRLGWFRSYANLLANDPKASFNERLLLGNGLCVSPLKQPIEGQPPQGRSLRESVYSINNEKDLQSHIIGFGPKIPAKPAEINYERHSTLASHQQNPPSAGNRQSIHMSGPQSTAQPLFGSSVAPQLPSPQEPARGPPGTLPGQETFRQQGQSEYGSYPPGGPNGSSHMIASQYPGQQHPAHAAPGNDISRPDKTPARPVFGITLDELFQRDGSAVPAPVYQCLQAVDLYGLEVEGIYRLSGTASHINKIKEMFDNDASRVDFRNPESFFHDVNSVAGTLKQFFRELPDPLLTSEHYSGFIDAGRIDDDIVRRDSLHAIINGLPDPNYATLRALALHLNRVQGRSAVNRMNAGNLAICFGPTLMGQNTGHNIADAGWQVRVIDTILQNTNQIFDED